MKLKGLSEIQCNYYFWVCCCQCCHCLLLSQGLSVLVMMIKHKIVTCSKPVISYFPLRCMYYKNNITVLACVDTCMKYSGANPRLSSVSAFQGYILQVCSSESGADPGEVKWVNFHPPPPFSEPPSFFFLSSLKY